MRRGVRYKLVPDPGDRTPTDAEGRGEDEDFPFSTASKAALAQIRQAIIQRKPVAYHAEFLNSYRPNVSHYLSEQERHHLTKLGGIRPETPAGTFARQLLNRFLIDLSWNSSRLEGNTYSLLDTLRLIHFNAEADGLSAFEAMGAG